MLKRQWEHQWKMLNSYIVRLYGDSKGRVNCSVDLATQISKMTLNTALLAQIILPCLIGMIKVDP
jgi:hypothetical protein